jgi:hypothetical protein
MLEGILGTFRASGKLKCDVHRRRRCAACVAVTKAMSKATGGGGEPAASCAADERKAEEPQMLDFGGSVLRQVLCRLRVNSPPPPRAALLTLPWTDQSLLLVASLSTGGNRCSCGWHEGGVCVLPGLLLSGLGRKQTLLWVCVGPLWASSVGLDWLSGR